MLAYAQSGETVFAACLRLFHSYPLAVRRHYAEHRYGSMVMMSREAGTASFFVLIMERDDLFAIRPWDRRDWARVEIRPREPVDDERPPADRVQPFPCSATACCSAGWPVSRCGRCWRRTGGCPSRGTTPPSFPAPW